jgi:hypothetical protein
VTVRVGDCDAPRETFRSTEGGGVRGLCSSGDNRCGGGCVGGGAVSNSFALRLPSARHSATRSDMDLVAKETDDAVFDAVGDRVVLPAALTLLE